MKPAEALGPAHPCLGCVHRGKTVAVAARKNKPGSWCLADKVPPAAREPICWGDELPIWCPGKETK